MPDSIRHPASSHRKVSETWLKAGVKSGMGGVAVTYGRALFFCSALLQARPGGRATMRHRSETTLAWFTLTAAGLHFVLETYFHLRWGQPLQALIVDYICVALMVSGGIVSLRMRPGSAAGLLAAGWAYALGFSWRSVFGRLESLAYGIRNPNGEPTREIATLLIVVLITIALVLVWALWLAWRQARSTRSDGRSAG